MKRFMNRFYDVVFTPSIRWYRMPRPDIKYPRYPSPASEPINHDQNVMDYKTAFRDSVHMIRYHDDQNLSYGDYVYIQDPVSETTAEKLIRYGYLDQSKRSDASAIEAARLKYQSEQGESVDVKIHRDDFGTSQKPISIENKESIAAIARQNFSRTRDINVQEGFLNDLDDIYNPNVYNFTTYDCAADDAIFRQLKLDIEWHISLIAEKREKHGYMPVFKGNPNFWTALDNSFSPENIKLVQSSIKDRVNNLDEKALSLTHNKEYYHGEGKISYPIQSTFVTD